MDVTRKPLALSSTPSEEMLMPLPSPETTPPVTTTYFIVASLQSDHERDEQMGAWWGGRGAKAQVSEELGIAAKVEGKASQAVTGLRTARYEPAARIHPCTRAHAPVGAATCSETLP